MILKHPPEDVDYLAWLFSDENLQRVEGISELKELMLAGLLYMQEEHSTHMYTSTVVSENGPLTKKPVNHNSDFMQVLDPVTFQLWDPRSNAVLRVSTFACEWKFFLGFSGGCSVNM